MTHIFKDIKSYADKETRIKQLDALTLDDVKNLYARVLNTAETNVTINSPIEEYPDMQNVFNYINCNLFFYLFSLFLSRFFSKLDPPS